MGGMGVLQRIFEDRRNQNTGPTHRAEIAANRFRKASDALIYLLEGGEAMLGENRLAARAAKIRLEGMTESTIGILIGANDPLDLFPGTLLESCPKDRPLEKAPVNENELSSANEDTIHDRSPWTRPRRPLNPGNPWRTYRPS